MSPPDTKVIFIGGASRTGSTLLSLLLGALPGYFAAGELRYLWLRGLQGNQLCGCGRPFRSCPFWGDVMKGALGPIDELDPEHYLSQWRDVARPMPVLRSEIGLESADTRRQRHEYLDALQRVLQSVDRVTGGQVIVDSSKYATDCALLTRLPGVSVHAIHLVRDSRAVAYSWQRKKARPEIHWQQQDMSLFSPWRSCFDWSSMNVAMEAVRRKVDRYDRIRYEDLVCDPVGVLTALLPAEAASSVADVVSGETAPPTGSHTVSGNPIRFESGPLTIRPDVEWITKLGLGDRRLVTALTWPLLLRYHYRLMPQDGVTA
jgi:hypothetical protein